MVGPEQVIRLSEDCNMSSVSTVDRLSTLPDNVIDAILVRLPIKAAVRTSILSRHWRYQWFTISELMFDRCYFSKHEDQEQSEFECKFVKIVDRVLQLHRGPVLGFTLSTNLGSCADIDRWILFLSRNGIKDLTLVKWKGGYYKLHSCLFSCNELTFLKLYRCRLNLPDSFKGFTNLTVLNLHSVCLLRTGLEAMLSLCPLLKELRLRNIIGCHRLKICALQLIYLSVDCAFEELSLENTPLLVFASIKLLSKHCQSVAGGTNCNLIEILGLPSIEKLELLGYTLQNSTFGDVPLKLPIIPQLKCLVVDINFEDMQVILAVMCCFQSSPVLQTLMIRAISDKKEARIPIDGFWEAKEDHDCLISSLKIIKVEQFSGIESEMKFIGFVLANAPVLETLQIEPRRSTRDMEGILKKLVRLRRRSAEAEIVI